MPRRKTTRSGSSGSSTWSTIPSPSPHSRSLSTRPSTPPRPFRRSSRPSRRAWLLIPPLLGTSQWKQRVTLLLWPPQVRAVPLTHATALEAHMTQKARARAHITHGMRPHACPSPPRAHTEQSEATNYSPTSPDYHNNQDDSNFALPPLSNLHHQSRMHRQMCMCLMVHTHTPGVRCPCK